MNNVFKFKSDWEYYEKEREGIKNNTVRFIDLSDERFIDLIGWIGRGWNDGDIKIRVQKGEDENIFFVRDIRDISIWCEYIIITWNPLKGE